MNPRLMDTVLLQAMKADVPLDVKCKDKFLLQSTKLVDTSVDANLSDLVLSRSVKVLNTFSGHKSKKTLWKAKCPKT